MDQFAISNRLPITPPVKEVRSSPSEDPTQQNRQQKHPQRKATPSDSENDDGAASEEQSHNLDELA